jgi:hypothetical protein
VLQYDLAALKGNKEQVNQVVALAKGKHGAEHCVAHAEALALARAGRLRPPIIQPGHGPGPARRATRDGSKLPGGASGVGKPFPEDAFVKFTHAPHSVTRKALEIVRSHEFTS